MSLIRVYLASAGLFVFPAALTLFSSPAVAQSGTPTKVVEFVNNGHQAVRVRVYQFTTPPGSNASVTVPGSAFGNRGSRMRLPYGCYTFCVRWWSGLANASGQRIYRYSVLWGTLPNAPLVCLGDATPDNAPPRRHVGVSHRWTGSGVGAAGQCPTASLFPGLPTPMPNIAGRWSGWGTIVLHRAGANRYTGTYSDSYSGPGRLDLRVNGRRVTGSWGESNRSAGRILSGTISSDGRTIRGTYDRTVHFRRELHGAKSFRWSRAANVSAGISTPMPDIAGTWKGLIAFGDVVLRKAGANKYSGTYTSTYGGGKGQINFVIRSGKITGTWGEGNTSAGRILSGTISPDGRRVSGTYDRTVHFKGYKHGAKSFTLSRQH